MIESVLTSVKVCLCGIPENDEAFDENLASSGKTLGLSNTYIFWHIRMPYCRQGMYFSSSLCHS